MQRRLNFPTFNFILSHFQLSNFPLPHFPLTSILKATNRVTVRSVAGAHIGTAAREIEVARTGAANRTAPIVAAGTDKAERTRAAAAVARHGQFKR